MSDFFSLSTGESAISESGSFEASAKRLLPDNTDVVAAPEEVKWDTAFTGEEHIKIRWNVLSPKEYAGAKIDQKIFITDDKPRSNNPDADRDKAKKMFMAIDKNAGGHVGAAGVKPTNESLTKFLTNKMMVLKVMVYSMEIEKNGEVEEITGNWIAAVSPKNKNAPVATSSASTPSAQSQANAMGVGQPIDEDIPF